ncbi:Phage-related baseplate assembly protein [Cohaesibacter sp. ES.047]|uniref:baseplate J/gp47 family protein n=1 Tax=Cohaesibacter sp. ES.047 TaxID=1798205 RepID=UPI000BB87A12|nr:baseplate J/gp47 family protein [Cohaesibacter sp. ES.047]SNY91464.1 Phage-related baseplate assembly protein [Cohaesibacter sp. ES.047]
MSSGLIKAYSAEELIARGAPQCFTVTSSQWKEKLVNWFETDADGPQRKLYPAQYEQILIDLLSYGFALLGQEGQNASKQRWLLFAEGKHLDVVAANNSTYRLKAAAATCELEITLDAALVEDFYLAAGTLVTGGKFSFVTDEQALIEAGALSARVGATATETGEAANGLMTGQINAFQSFQEGVSVVNVTDTEGGADEEGDASIRMRAAYAHDRISKAGPKESYRQQVLAYSSAIIAVAVVRPEPGHIWIYVLLEDGVPSEDYCARVADWLDPEGKRPQGDDVSVFPAEAVSFTISGTALITGNATTAKSELESDLGDASGIWQRALGPYLALSALTVVARNNANLVDIDLVVSGLQDRQLEPHQFGVVTDIDLTMEVVDG